MFMASREVVLDYLARLGSQACCYMPSHGNPAVWAGPTHGCDCKYGHDPLGPAPAFHGQSEQTGCPELRTVHRLIATMGPAEYALLMMRAGGTPSGRAGLPAVVEGEAQA